MVLSEVPVDVPLFNASTVQTKASLWLFYIHTEMLNVMEE